MERFHVFTVGERQLHLYLPPAYKSSPEARFPVVYVQDSGELFQRCLNELEHHFRQGKLPELIFVGIKPFDRNNDYTPWPADELLASKPPFGGNGRAYVDELADVIKPYIDANYRTKPEAEHTAIVGGSLGALIAMFAGYWRPEVFGRLGLLSASFWYEGVLDYVIGQPAPAEHIRMYMSVGDCEGIYKTNAQRNMFPYTKQAHAALLAKDGDDRRLRFEVTEGGTHDFHHMGLRLSDALAWLFAPDGGGEREKRAAEGDAPAIIERPYTIPGTREWTMHARRTGKEYRINVYIPASPPPEQGFPVLYALDGNASFGTLAEAMRLQGRPPRGFEPGVVVGIGYPSEEPIVTDRRFDDFTELAIPSKLPVRPTGGSWPETGGADDFLAFIEEELKPAVEHRINIDRTRQTLFGHSLGGWFTLYALAERPDAFAAYIAGSPSIWWNGASIVERVADVLAQRQQHGTAQAGISFYIGIGGKEKPSMVADAKRLYEKLLPLEAQGLRLAYREFEGEGHLSVILPMISDLLRFIMTRESVAHGAGTAH